MLFYKSRVMRQHDLPSNFLIYIRHLHVKPQYLYTYLHSLHLTLTHHPALELTVVEQSSKMGDIFSSVPSKTGSKRRNCEKFGINN